MRSGVSLQVRECCLNHATILCLLLPRNDREIDIKTNWWSGQCRKTHFPPEVQFLFKIDFIFPSILRKNRRKISARTVSFKFPHLPLLSRTHAKFAPSKTHPPTQLEERDFFAKWPPPPPRPKNNASQLPLYSSTVLVHPPSLFSLVPPTPLASKRHHPTCTTYSAFPTHKNKINVGDT